MRPQMKRVPRVGGLILPKVTQRSVTTGWDPRSHSRPCLFLKALRGQFEGLWTAGHLSPLEGSTVLTRSLVCTTDVLYDLGQVVSRFSLRFCTRRRPQRLTRPVIVERTPCHYSVPRPRCPQSAPLGSEPALKSHASGVPTPFSEDRVGPTG